MKPNEKILFLCVAAAYISASSASILARALADAMFLSYFGRNYLSAMYIGTAVVVGPLAYFFGVYSRTKVLSKVQIVSCTLMALSAVLLRLGLTSPSGALRVVTYLWADVTVFGSMLLFWSFFAQVFDIREAKKLVGRIGAAGTCACILAGFAIQPFVRVLGIPSLLMVVAVLMLVFAGSIYFVVHRFGIRTDAVQAGIRGTVEVPDLAYYFKLLQSERVRNLALQVAIGTAAVVLVDYQFKTAAQAHYQGTGLVVFFGNFYAIANILVLGIQLLALRSLLGGRMLLVSLCILPLGLLLGNSAAALIASFGTIVATKFISLTTLFTIDTASLQILYLGVKKQSQNQVRALVEGVAKPFAVGVTGVLLVLLSRLASLYVFAAISVPLCLIWLWLAKRNYALYVSGLVEGLNSRLLDVSGESDVLCDNSIKSYIGNKLMAAPVSELRYLLAIIGEDRGWTFEIRNLLERPEAELKIAALEYLGKQGDKFDLKTILKHFEHPEVRVRRAAIRAAGALDGYAVLEPLIACLDDPCPEVSAEAASVLIVTQELNGLFEGVAVVKAMLDSKDEICRRAAAETLSRLPIRGRTKFILQLLEDPRVDVRISALKACASIQDSELVPALIAELSDPETSEFAEDALVGLGPLTVRYLSEYSDAELSDNLERVTPLIFCLVRIGGPEALDLVRRASILDTNSETSSLLMRTYCELLRTQHQIDGNLPYWEFLFQQQLKAAQQRRHALRSEILLPSTSVLTRALREDYAAHVEHILENVLPRNFQGPVLALAELERSPADPVSARKLICKLLDADQSEPVVMGALYAAAENGLREAAPAIEERAAAESFVVKQIALYALDRIADGKPAARQRLSTGETKMVIVETVVFLQNVPLFSGMTINELIRIARIAKEVTCIAGSRIIEEGEPGDHMFIIVDGEVVVHRGDVQLKKLGPQDFFGEMSIIDGEVRSASVSAISDCLMLRIDQSDFQQLLWTHNAIAVSLLKMMSKRLRASIDQRTGPAPAGFGGATMRLV